MPSFRSCLLILTCALAVLTGTAHAAPARVSAAAAGDPREKAEAFFGTVIQGDTAKAFDTLFDGSIIRTNKPEASSALRQQLDAGLRVYGKPAGFDLVESKSFGGSLVRLVYIFRLEKYPLTFEFFFYQNGQGWLPIDVRFNDKLDVYRYDRVPVADTGSYARLLIRCFC